MRLGGDSDALDFILAMPDDPLQHGGSLIVGPDGIVLVEAGPDAQVLTATLDLAQRDAELAALDVDGHYSRPDVFELIVGRAAKVGVSTRQL